LNAGFLARILECEFLINKKSWDALPKDLRKILELSSAQTAFDQKVVYNLEGIALMKKMKSEGLKWGDDISEKEKDIWKTVSMDVWKEYETDPYSIELIKIQKEFLTQIKDIGF